MEITRFSQAPLDKANELFDKLLATSNNTLRSREQLLAELKEELQLLATLQEAHVSRKVVDRSQKRLQRNLDGLQALARCRSMTDFVDVQSSLLRDNVEQAMEHSRRIVKLTIQMAEEAARTVMVQAERTAQRLNRAA